MKWTMQFLGILGITFLLLGLSQLFKPEKTSVIVEKSFKASKEQVYKAFTNIETFNLFNEWAKLNPKSTRFEYSKIKEGQGASYSWKDTLDKNKGGSGTFKIEKVKPYSSVEFKMSFGEDANSGKGIVTILEENGETKVTWSFIGNEPAVLFDFMDKVYDDTIKKNINQSLINLKGVLKNIQTKTAEMKVSVKEDLVQFPEDKKIIALYQETSTDDKQEIVMAFQESMGMMYSYLADDQNLIAGEGFTDPVVIYDKWDEENKIAKFHIGFMITKEVPVGEGMTIITIPASSMIKKTYTGSYGKIREVHNVIKKYIEKENLEMTGSPFEIFKSLPTVPDKDKITEIYYPVKE